MDFAVDFWISRGFLDFMVDFWISRWISLIVYEISGVAGPSVKHVIIRASLLFGDAISFGIIIKAL